MDEIGTSSGLGPERSAARFSSALHDFHTSDPSANCDNIGLQYEIPKISDSWSYAGRKTMGRLTGRFPWTRVIAGEASTTMDLINLPIEPVRIHRHVS